MILLAGVSVVIIVGDFEVFGVGLGSTALLCMCAGALWLSSGYERRHVWTVVDKPGSDSPTTNKSVEERLPVRLLVVKTGAVGLVILIAGFLLSRTGDAIAEQSGFGASLVGFVLVAFATSLPELSSVVAALQRRRYEMAVGDIFGTNLFNIGLIFLADLFYSGGPILSQAGPFESTAALLALVLTGIFVLGLLERKDRTVLWMGYDSLAALAVFAAGLMILYRLAPGA